jgi:hypothetical protein
VTRLPNCASSLRLVGRAGAFAGAVALSFGCAKGADSSDFGDGGTSGGLFGGGNDGGQGNSSFNGNGGNGGTLGADAGANSGSGSSDAGGHGMRCQADGACSCIAIASIGHEGVWGPCSGDTTTAFQTWLNTQSTATVDTYDTVKPTLTQDFLSKYDVIVLQWMVANGMQGNDGAPWQFAQSEVDALRDWVKAGGGVVALNGYQATDPSAIEDIFATNQLLSFTDIKFNQDIQLTNNNLPQAYCWGGADVLGSPPDSGTGTWDQTTPVGAHVSAIGTLDMRSITSTMATVDCTDGMHSYAVHEQVGMGHVVAYGDEWITYSGEWLGTSKCMGDGGIYSNMYDPCYQQSAPQVFQIPQLWYNMIKYAASSVACFTITNPSIIPR